MPVLKNAKHERFAQELAKGESATRAYVLAGYQANDSNAARLSGNERIGARAAELLGRAADRAECTVASILAELEEARRLALCLEQPGPAVSASMGKAKVSGLLVDRTEHTGANGGPIETKDVSARDLLADKLAGLAARHAEDGVPSKPH